MISALTLSEIRAQVRELIGWQVFDRLFFPNGSYDWTDAGIQWAQEQTACLMGLTRLNTQIAVGTAPSGLNNVVLPDDCIRVVACLFQTGVGTMGKVLLESTMKIEDEKNPNWKGNGNNATAWVQQDGESILLNGISPSGFVLVGYIQEPTAMVNDGDNPDPRIPPYFHQFLKYAAATYLLMLSGQGQNKEKASGFFDDFTTGLGVGKIPLASVNVQR